MYCRLSDSLILNQKHAYFKVNFIASLTQKEGMVFNLLSQVWIWMWYSPDPASIYQIRLILWVIQIQRKLLMSNSMSCCLLSYVIGSKLKRLFGWVALDIIKYVVLQTAWWRSWTKIEAVLNQVLSWTGVKVVMWFWPMAVAIFFDTLIRLFTVPHWFWI